MTVVVRDPKGTVKVLSKGADSILLPLLKKRTSAQLKKVTENFLDQYAKEGLRTLLLVEKVSIIYLIIIVRS